MYYLTPQEFDKAMKCFDSNIQILRYGWPEIKYHGYCIGLKYKGEYVGSLPPYRVYDRRIKEYGVEISGHKIPYRSINDILRMISQYLKPYKIKRFKQFMRSKNWKYLQGEN